MLALLGVLIVIVGFVLRLNPLLVVTCAGVVTGLAGGLELRAVVEAFGKSFIENRYGDLSAATRYHIRAHAAGVDNVALFFGEDIFIAIGSILLIKGFLEQNGIRVEPLQVALWAIPTAVAALMVHGVRLLLLDRRLNKQFEAAEGEDAA